MNTIEVKLNPSYLKPFGLKRYQIFEPETHWNMKVTAKNPEQARSKAWVQGGWDKLPFTHCKKESFEVREL